MRNYIERRRASEKGFTLIELLVVIVILGILAAVVVFAVSGLSDKGNTSACKIDTRTIRTAEEAYSSQQAVPAYEPTHAAVQGAAASNLVADKFLADAPTLHAVSDTDITAGTATTPPSYKIVITATGEEKGCGTAGNEPGQTASDF